MTEQPNFDFRDRRRSNRTRTSIPAVAKTTMGTVHHVEICDLSAEGCVVIATGHPLVPGNVYSLELGGLEGLVSIARWSNGRDCGLAFDRPLHPAIADHIAAAHPRRAA